MGASSGQSTHECIDEAMVLDEVRLENTAIDSPRCKLVGEPVVHDRFKSRTSLGAQLLRERRHSTFFLFYRFQILSHFNAPQT